MGTIFVELIGIAGVVIALGVGPGDSCATALQELHEAHNMRIVATDKLKDTLVYTLVEDVPTADVEKTALLRCRPVEEDDDD